MSHKNLIRDVKVMVSTNYSRFIRFFQEYYSKAAFHRETKSEITSFIATEYVLDLAQKRDAYWAIISAPDKFYNLGVIFCNSHYI